MNKVLLVIIFIILAYILFNCLNKKKLVEKFTTLSPGILPTSETDGILNNFYTYTHPNKVSNFYKVFLFVNVILLSLAGHYGGYLTHGEDYLTKYMPVAMKKMIGLDNENAEYIVINEEVDSMGALLNKVKKDKDEHKKRKVGGAARIVIIIISLLLVSNLPLFSFKINLQEKIKSQTNFFRIILFLSSIALFFAFKFAALPFIVILYIILSVINNIIKK